MAFCSCIDPASIIGQLSPCATSAREIVHVEVFAPRRETNESKKSRWSCWRLLKVAAVQAS